MEHEVYVPFSVGSVRAALADSARVARCVPGLQPERPQDAGSSPDGDAGSSAGEGATQRLAGRLKVRIGGSTITYRGSASLTPHAPTGTAAALDGLERLEVEGSGSEARGEGTVELALSVEPRAADDGEGTALVCVGTVTGTGRLAGIEEKTASSAGVRMLDRFAAALGDSIRDEPPPGSHEAESAGGAPAGGAVPGGGAEEDVRPVAGGIGAPDDNERAIPGIPEPEAEPGRASGRTESGRTESGRAESGRTESDSASGRAEREDEAEATPLFETEIPPSSLGRDDEDEAALAPGDGAPSDAGALGAEAAHARRTMIGRSAEEVDHAPPRGRYAPVPSPEPNSATETLRWAAPAAAVAVAGAVVIGRVLRRRR
ncbi:hypothetical protein MMF93_17425 [Streptomyces tubbatahanensis]|uniref:Carbon monoxide dehydrogenase subunit G n=1 Tax=Streptomyces tubbatahanensis TaxID=2923272 RepID=A0ABY3XUJ6_9ACTN|nr:hypothetical protein [Streptomyces tubbatahanensis]UNS98050.1 hypothetical protein MMF93_17425 [Streptomyces tubbatahanensis]